MEAIKVDNLRKSYKEHEAVRGISFTVQEGELFAFLGENRAILWPSCTCNSTELHVKSRSIGFRTLGSKISNIGANEKGSELISDQLRSFGLFLFSIALPM